LSFETFRSHEASAELAKQTVQSKKGPYALHFRRIRKLHRTTFARRTPIIGAVKQGNVSKNIIAENVKWAFSRACFEYSALCLCEGMQENGVLHTIDIKEELVDFQRKYFDKSPWGKQIVQHLGEALDIIPTINSKFDLVFIDADKENYINYFNMIVPKMNKGGIILSDNVLWSGKVLEKLDPNDTSTAVLLEYNQLLKNDSRIETVLLPIRDGLTVSRIL